MNKFLIIVTVLIIVLVGAYYLLFTNPDQVAVNTPTSTPSAIKIGLMMPFSGDNASLGESALAGAQLAVKEINQTGGVNGRLIEVSFEDDQCSKEGGVAAMTRLVVIKEATTILGSLCSEAMSSANAVAQVAGVPVIIAGASAVDLTKAGEFIFRINPSDQALGAATADYIFQKLEKEKAALVYENNFNKNAEESFIGKTKELGKKLIAEVGLDSGAKEKDIKSVANKIKAGKPDVVYLLTSPTLGLTLVKPIKDSNPKTMILGNSSWDLPLVLTAKEAEGIFYLTAKTNNFEEFKNKLKEQFGKEGTNYSAYIYDSINILAEVMKQTGTDKKSLRAGLISVFYDKGISAPLIEFDDNRELKNFVLEMRAVKNGQSEPFNLENNTTASASSTQ